MFQWFSDQKRSLAILLVAASALGAWAWVYRGCIWSEKSDFLPARAPAKWIVYPYPADGMAHSRVNLDTVFRSGFVLDNSPAKATVRVAAYRSYRLVINGFPLEKPVSRGRNWKEPDFFEVTKEIRSGKNQIEVTVGNDTGPPALWLVLEVDGSTLASGEKWGASLAGSAWKTAVPASQPVLVIPGSTLAGGERPLDSLESCWPTLLIFVVLSVVGYYALEQLKRQSLLAKQNEGGWRGELLTIGLIITWVALFANNLSALPSLYGFDAPSHMKYISYILEHKALPLANQGFEMFQPPLYYIIAAGLLKLCGLTISQPGGVLAVRLLGLGVGIWSFLLVRASLRLLFPEEPIAAWGVVLAACLAPVVYLAHYITNEAFAAASISTAIYLTLRLLKQKQMPWRSCLLLGFCLGAAMLAKSTALLVLPVTFGSLFWAWLENRALPFTQWAARAGSIVFVAVAVCGWHYWRTFQHFGNPFIGVWDPKTGYEWWQDPGYHTAAFFARFGESLQRPWFSSFSSFADGIYSSLWGDGFLGGSAHLLYRPPWNFEVMAVGYWLALIPSAAVAIGGFLAVRRFLRQPTAEMFLLLGLGFLVVLALVQMCIAVPYYCTVKAFYGLCALIPFCMLGALGCQWLARRHLRLKPVLYVLIGLWAINSFASMWIVRSSNSFLIARALSLHAGGSSSEAAGLLKARLLINPRSTELRSLLGLILNESGNIEEAGKNAETVLGLAPRDAVSHSVIAAALRKQQRWEEADAHDRSAMESAPGRFQSYQALAISFLDRGLIQPAVQTAREGLAMAPFNPQLRFVLGSALAAGGNNDEAIEQLQLTSQLEPGWVEARHRLGRLLMAQGRLDEAAVQLEAALRKATNDAALHLDLGRALLGQGKFEPGTNHLFEALRLDPKLSGAMQAVAWIYATDPRPGCRNGTAAVRLAEEASRVTQHNDPEVERTLAAAYAEIGRFEDAIAVASRARLAAGNNGQVQLEQECEHLIELFTKQQPFRENRR